MNRKLFLTLWILLCNRFLSKVKSSLHAIKLISITFLLWLFWSFDKHDLLWKYEALIIEILCRERNILKSLPWWWNYNWGNFLLETTFWTWEWAKYSFVVFVFRLLFDASDFKYSVLGLSSSKTIPVGKSFLMDNIDRWYRSRTSSKLSINSDYDDKIKLVDK